MLTPEQITEIRAKSKLPPLAPIASLGGTTQNTVGKFDYLLKAPKEDSYLSNLGTAAVETGKDLMGVIPKRAGQLEQGLTRTGNDQQNVGQLAVNVAGAGAGAINDVIGSVFNLGVQAIPQLIRKPVGDAIKNLSNAMVNNETIYTGLNFLNNNIDKYKEWETENPTEAQQVKDFVNVALLYPGAPAAKGASEVVGQSIVKPAEAAIASGVSKVGEVAGKVAKPIVEAGQVAKEFAGGAVETVAKGAKPLAEKLASYGTSQSTGLSPDTIKRIISNPDDFAPEVMKTYTREGVAQKAIGDINTRLKNLSETGSEYQGIRDSKQTVIVDPKNLTTVFDKYGIKFDEAGKIIRSKDTVPLKGGDVSAMEDFFKIYGADSYYDSNSFLNARKALDNMSNYDRATGSDISSRIARDLRGVYDKEGKAQIDGLASLDAKYAPEVKILKKVKKDYFNADGSMKDNAISKIANLSNEGRDSVLKRLEQVSPGIGETVKTLKAVEDIERAAGQKVGTYVRGTIAGGAVLTGNLPAIVLSIMSEPRIATKILRGYGKMIGAEGTAVEKVVKAFEGVKENVGRSLEQKVPKMPRTLEVKKKEVNKKFDAEKQKMIPVKSSEVDINNIIIEPSATNKLVKRQIKYLDEMTTAEKESYLNFKKTAYNDHQPFADRFNKINEKYNLETFSPQFKSDGRAVEKSIEDYGRNFSKVSDMNRGAYIVDNLDNVSSLIKDIENTFVVKKVNDRFINQTLGYRDFLIKVELPNGTIGEIQIIPKEMAKAKDATHILYEESRTLESQSKLRLLSQEEKNRKLTLEIKQQKVYNKAWEPYKQSYESNKQSLVDIGKGKNAPVGETFGQITGKELGEIVSKIKEGGITFDMIKKSPRSNEPLFAVSIYPENSVILDRKNFTTKDVYEFIRKNRKMLDKPNHFLGGWYDTESGKIYLDVSIAVKDKTKAVSLGKKFNQKSVFDLMSLKEINTGGTGESLIGQNILPRIHSAKKL